MATGGFVLGTIILGALVWLSSGPGTAVWAQRGRWIAFGSDRRGWPSGRAVPSFDSPGQESDGRRLGENGGHRERWAPWNQVSGKSGPTPELAKCPPTWRTGLPQLQSLSVCRSTIRLRQEDSPPELGVIWAVVTFTDRLPSQLPCCRLSHHPGPVRALRFGYSELLVGVLDAWRTMTEATTSAGIEGRPRRDVRHLSNMLSGKSSGR